MLELREVERGETKRNSEMSGLGEVARYHFFENNTQFACVLFFANCNTCTLGFCNVAKKVVWQIC